MRIAKLQRLVIAGALALAGASSAMAAPLFTVTPSGSGIGGPAGSFQADFISGVTSELLTINTATQSLAGSGWVQFSAFSNTGGGGNVPNNISGLGTNYGLYIKFTLTDTLASGPFLGANSTYTLTTLSFQVFADPGNTNTYTTANAPTSRAATVNDNGTVDLLLGSGSLVAGVAGFDQFGGAFINATDTFALTALGSGFFTSPVPFYNLAFSEFNNTSTGILTNAAGTLLSITNASGGVDFATVPEPASLALVGLALVGLALVGPGIQRKRKDA